MMEEKALEQNFKEVIKKCREAMGINYSVMMHNHYLDYRKALEKRDANAVAEIGYALSHPMLKQQHYSLHRELCEVIVKQGLALGFVPQLSNVLAQLALTCDVEANFQRANEIYELCFRLLDEHEANTGDAALKFRAILWYNRAQKPRMGESNNDLVRYAENAMRCYELLDDSNGVSLCLNRIATALPDDNLDKKIEMLNRVIAIQKSNNGQPVAIAMAEINIGFFEIKKGNVEFGAGLMKQAVKVIEQHANKRYAALAYLHFARGLANAQRFQEAESACNYAEGIFKAYDIKMHLCDVEQVRKEILNTISKKV